MKILLTSDLSPKQVNGVVVSVTNLKKELESIPGNEVRLLTLSPDIHSHKVEDTYFIGSLPFNIYPDVRASLKVVDPFIEEIIRWKPDIIHSQCEFFTYSFVERIARRTKPYIVHTYHTLYQYYLNYFLPEWVGTNKTAVSMIGPVMRVRLRLADVVIAPTKKTQRLLEKSRVSDNIRVIPTGIDLRKFDQPLSDEKRKEILSRLEIPYEAPIYGSVGRLAQEKNLTEIIKAHQKILEKAPDAYLLLVGDGKYRPELEDLVSDLGIGDRVRFTGMIPAEEVNLYYKILNFFVSASISETQGLTYIEALAGGLPVLARRDEAVENVVIPGENGFIFDTTKELEDATLSLIQDQKRLRKLQEGAVHSREDFSTQKFGQRVNQLYEELYYSGKLPKSHNADLLRATKQELASLYDTVSENLFDI